MITIINLTKRYGKKVVLDNVNLKIDDVGISYFLGKNGSGKSSFIKCLLDLEDYEGRILYDGKPNNHDSKKVFAIFDDNALHGSLSGLQNLSLITGYKYEDIIYKAEDYFTEQILKSKTHTYSYGQKKKLFIIAVELLKPEIIIMDEISSGLDYETLLILRERILKWSNESSVILTGHQFDFYNSIIDHLFIVNNSRIEKTEYEGTVSLEEIYESL